MFVITYENCAEIERYSSLPHFQDKARIMQFERKEKIMKTEDLSDELETEHDLTKLTIRRVTRQKDVARKRYSI